MSDAYDTRLLIGGEQVAGTGPQLEVDNPYDESLLARFGAPALDQIDAAIAAARNATRDWAGTPAAERGEMLHAASRRGLSGLIGTRRAPRRQTPSAPPRRRSGRPSRPR